MSNLILIRHGQSVWNSQNRFTGWYDVALSDKGLLEANTAGVLIKKLNIAVTFRARNDIYQLSLLSIPVRHSYRLLIMLARPIPKIRNSTMYRNCSCDILLRISFPIQVPKIPTTIRMGIRYKSSIFI